MCKVSRLLVFFIYSQRQSQIRTLLQTIDYNDILQQLSENKKPQWFCCRFRGGDLGEKLQNEGVSNRHIPLLDYA